NSAEEVFLQLRSRRKDRHPLLWDSSAAGHVNAGEEYDQAAARELTEELGIQIPLEKVAKLTASERTDSEFVSLYYGSHDGKVQLKAVRLFFRASLRVDAADVRFRIGIGSSSHERLPNKYVKQRENQRVALFLSLRRRFFQRRQIPSAPPFFIFIGRQQHVAWV